MFQRHSYKIRLALAALLAAASTPLYAQGCIVARSTGQPVGPGSEGGYLKPGEFNLSIGFRHLYSFRHFVGSQEQTYRIQQGTQVMNKINLTTVALTYQISPRYSVTADLPMLMASRRSNNSAYTTAAQGIGDIGITAQGWVFNPQHEKLKGNVQFGLGVVLPTGRNNITNRVDAFDGKGPRDVTLDYSVQPGTGGYGIVFTWQSFLDLGRVAQGYFNGSYMATPQNTTNVLRNTTTVPNALLTQYASISDEYYVETGVAKPIRSVRGLIVNAGPRMEGVPADDLIGDSLGFRRPGFAVAMMFGASYVRGAQSFTASVGKAFLRDRTRSVPDKANGGHGDAAFADYVWLANYSYRFGGRGH